jgi:diguanylate cyclase (GGDEF)-like protein/PAS domain S-box-containing protein
MPDIYLTPASISYLNQFILALVITAYLGLRLFLRKDRRPPISQRLLPFFFITVTLFSLALFLEVSLLPTWRLIVVYTLNTILALLLVALIQFAYYFPQPSEKHTLERRLALLASLIYLGWELRIAVSRFSLLSDAKVVYRPPNLDYAPAIFFAWAIFVFGRSSVQNWRSPASRRFALIFLIPLGLVLLTILRSFYGISNPLYHISISIGILLTIFLFALNYLVSQPEATSLLVKFSGAILTGILAVFGVVAWLVTPAYAAQYRSGVIDHRSIRFSPNAQGGYDIAEIPFFFDEEWGQQLDLDDGGNHLRGYREVAFDFSFFGEPTTRLFITDNGLLSFGQMVEFWSLEYHLSNAPIFFALGLDLDPRSNPDGGVYLRTEPERLTITYDRLRAFYHPEREYTFQVVLYGGGQIDLTYNGLPGGPQYQVNDRPDANPWVIGAKPAGAAYQLVSFAGLPLSSGPGGALDDQNRAFRQYIHTFLAPLAAAILVSSLLFLLGLPLMLNSALAQPMRRLLAGVERFNQEKRHRQIPVQFNDEVGFLTQSFNTLTSELDNLIQTLETRVADRTGDLLAANTELRKLSIAVEQSPSVIIITDPQADIEYVNPAFTLSSGYSFEEVRGKNPRFLQSGQTSPEIFAQMWATLLAGKTWRGELANCRKNGEIFWEHTVIASIENAEGQITHYVAVKEDITARKAAERELERLATTDPLTGLFNRRSFFAEAEKIFARSQQTPYELAVLMMDIDHFKTINDRYGHQAGDAVLQEVAARLLKNLRPADVIARYGGEEFVVMLPRLPHANLASLTSRLTAAVRDAPVEHGGERITVTISIGAALLDEDSRSLDQLLTCADQAMYQAKQRGRDCWVIWQS